MIYFDQASLQKPYEEALNIADAYSRKYWGNPNSIYSFSDQSSQIVEWARKIIADSLNTEPENIYFTSGSTESINWFCRNLKDHRVYTTNIEHLAVLNTINNPEFVPLYKDMTIDYKKIPKNSIVITAYINNEIGSICPVSQLLEREPVLFIDATQAYGHIPIDVKKDKVDFLCASAQKFGGLPGTGFLYVAPHMKHSLFDDGKYYLQHGGDQERGVRAGTLNVHGIVAMGKAAEISLQNRREKNFKISQIRNYLYGEITNNIPCAHINGSAFWKKRWAGNLNFRFDGYRGEEILAWFDQNDICVSTGSACHAESDEPSHVLKAIGLNDDQANSSIRFSFNESNTLSEAKEVYRVLKQGLEVLNHD